MVNYKSKYLKYKLKYKKYGGMQDNNQELISKDEIFEILQNRHNIKQLSYFMKLHPKINENKIDYIIDKFINLKQHVGIKNIKEVVNDVNFENINKSKLDHILIRQYITNKINNFNKFSKNDEINHIINIIKEINLDIFKEEDIEVINFFKEQVDELQLSYDMKEVILQKLNESYDNEVDSEKVYFLLKILNKNTNDKLQEDYIQLLKNKENSKYLLSGHGLSLEDLFIVPDNIIIITTIPNNFVCYSHPNTSNKVHCNKSFDKIEDFYKYNLSIDKSRIYYPGQIMRNMIFVFKNIWDNPFKYCHGGLISEHNYNRDVEQKITSFKNDRELMNEITKFHDFRLYSQNNQGFQEKNIKHKHNYSDELSNIIYNISHNLKFNLKQKNKKIILFLKACRKSNNNDVPIECNIEQMDTISNRTLELEPKLQLSRALSFSSNVTDLNLKQDFNIFLKSRLTHHDKNIRQNLYTPIQNHMSYIDFINTNVKTLLNNNNRFTFSLKELCNFYNFLNLKKEEELNGTTEKRLNDDKKQEKIEKYKLKEIEDKIKYKSCNSDKRAVLRRKNHQKDGIWTVKDINNQESVDCCEKHQENLPILDNTGHNTYISREPYTKDTVLTKKNPDFDGENQKESTATKRSIESKYKTTTKNPDFDGEKQKESTATKKSRKKPKPKNRTSKKRNSGKNNKTLMKI